LADARERQKRYAEARTLGIEGIKIYTAEHGAEGKLVKEWQEWLDQLPAAPAATP